VGYATASDLETFGAPAAALDGLYSEAIAAQLEAASSVADSYLRNHYKLPIVAPYPPALTEAVARIATFNLLSVRGYNPEGDAGLLETRYKTAMRWLESVGSGKASPLLIAADGPTANAGGPFVVQNRYDSSQDGFVVGRPSHRGW
jgi:phage gp36-like protein